MRNRYLVIALSLFFVFLLIVVLIYRNFINPVMTVETPIFDVAVEEIDEVKDVSTIKDKPIADSGVTYQSPVLLEDLNLIPFGPDQNIVSVEYYKIAQLENEGELILLKGNYPQAESYFLARIKKVQDKYYYLAKHSQIAQQKEFEAIFDPSKLEFDDQTVYESLEPAQFLLIDGETLKKGAQNYLFSQSEQAQFLRETEYGKLYKISGKSEKLTYGFHFALVLPDQTYIPYDYNFSFVSKNGMVTLNWINGAPKSDSYKDNRAYDCKTPHSIRAISASENLTNRLISAATTIEGDKVYTLSSTDPISAELYALYQERLAENAVSPDNYLLDKAFIIYKTKLNDYVIFTQKDYASIEVC